MPFCPKCDAEYFEEMEYCPGCGCEISKFKDEVHFAEHVELVVLGEFSDRYMAEMVAQALKNEGIPSLMQSDFLSIIELVYGSFAGSRTRILVSKSSLEKSKEILDSIMGGT